MSMGQPLDGGRESFVGQAWGDAFALLSAADGEAPLGLEDLERLAVAAYLVDRDDDSAEVWARAHHECLGVGDAARAARCAFWLALGLLLRGEVSTRSSDQMVRRPPKSLRSTGPRRHHV